jgi:hypothetical protein
VASVVDGGHHIVQRGGRGWSGGGAAGESPGRVGGQGAEQDLAVVAGTMLVATIRRQELTVILRGVPQPVA